jgi:hypothetical protein
MNEAKPPCGWNESKPPFPSQRKADLEIVESLRECVRSWGGSHNELIAEVCGDGPWISDTTEEFLKTIEGLRVELAAQADVLRHTEYWLGVRTEERDAQAALVAELREELTLAQNALANSH